MLLPERSESVLLINKREIQEAQPIRLWRKRNSASLLDLVIPRRTYLSLRDIEGEFRQGSLVELYYGIGTGQQRIFLGYLPSVLSDRSLQESDARIHVTAYDFIGQLADRTITLGTSINFLNPIGQEIGGFIATLAQSVIDLQYQSIDFSIQGVRGTSPQQFITEENAKLGTDTAKTFLDYYTSLAFDDSPYPDNPLLYEYAMRDQYLIWRKEISLSSNPVMRLTIGKDAIVGGTIERMPIYTDAICTTTDPSIQWEHNDRDSSRRWGGRRFYAKLSVPSSAMDKAQEAAVRMVELYKSERRSFNLVTMRDTFLLHPGDIIAIDNAQEAGLPSGNHRVVEVDISLSPTVKTTITVGDTARLLTDYL